MRGTGRFGSDYQARLEAAKKRQAHQARLRSIEAAKQLKQQRGERNFGDTTKKETPFSSYNTLSPINFLGGGVDYFGNKVLKPAIEKAQGDISEIPNIGKNPSGTLFGGLAIGSLLNPGSKEALAADLAKNAPKKAGKLLPILENIMENTREIPSDIAEYFPHAAETAGKIIVPRGNQIPEILRAISYPGIETDAAFEEGLTNLVPRVNRIMASFDLPNMNLPLDEAMSRRFVTTMQSDAFSRLKDSPLFQELIGRGLINRAKDMSPDQWKRATSVMRYFTRNEGLLPLNIVADVTGSSRVRPLSWQADHAPWGLSWLDEALNAAIDTPEKLSTKQAKEFARGYNYIMNKSGVWIPKAANIALGSPSRLGATSPAWTNLEELFPNMAGWLTRAGLPETYAEMGTEMQKEAKTAFNLASEYGDLDILRKFFSRAANFAGKTAGI